MNQLIATRKGAMSDTAKALTALAEGDLTHRIICDYQGLFGQVKDSANSTAENLTRVVEAAKEIGDLAGNSVSTTEPAGKLLDEIVSSIQKTSELVQDIAAASAEQSESVVQIGGAMGQLSKATQQNASASEELAATSEELSGQAEQLQQSIAFFKTGNVQAVVHSRHEVSHDRRASAPRLTASLTPAAVRGGGNFKPY